MALTSKALVAFLSIAAAAFAADKDKPKFSPGPIDTYPARQTVDKVTIAADPVVTDAQAEPAFGKVNPNKYNILPVLVIIQNSTGQTISLDTMKVEVVSPDRQHVAATPAQDLKYIIGPDRPGVYTGPIPGRGPRITKRKNPLKAWEIEGRAFAARMLPPNETASGFFYFQAPYRSGTSLYITGLRDVQSGKELFYFEIPLDKK